MRKIKFKEWLQNNTTLNHRAICDAASRCKRVENAFDIDLDNEYIKDKCEAILEKLSYGKRDQDNGIFPPEKLNMIKNVVINISQLRYSVKKYVKFLENN